MAVKIITAAVRGIDGFMISVEIDIERGLPCFNIVGLAEASVRESKERVRAAIINSGFEFPVARIIVNLAPADVRKDGSQFDLPIAIGILTATNQIVFTDTEEFVIMGELSLFGELKGIKGVLPITIEAIKNNINSFLLPYENANECSAVKGSKAYYFNDLKQVAGYISYRDLVPYEYSENYDCIRSNLDFEDVIGQESCKRAVEVAAAGNHNILMVGAPGSGKTMIAERIPSILPELTYEESLEVTKIYSILGKLDCSNGLIKNRPFRNPHHNTTVTSIIGGGNLMPGEVSLSHNGVLFLDEVLEFKSKVLEALRQPLEEKKIRISRLSGNVEYPANFMAVFSTNPCPCGFYKSSRPCTCSDYERKRYINKLSGPIIDRIDLFTFVNPISYNEIQSKTKNENSSCIRNRVEMAREIQKERFKNYGIHCNSEMNTRLIKKYCKLSRGCSDIMATIYNKFNLSTRAYSRILKVSRTIADLEGSKNIEKKHIVESLQYRRFLNEEII